jgi:hypothetical protein
MQVNLFNKPTDTFAPHRDSVGSREVAGSAATVFGTQGGIPLKVLIHEGIPYILLEGKGTHLSNTTETVLETKHGRHLIGPPPTYGEWSMSMVYR